MDKKKQTQGLVWVRVLKGWFVVTFSQKPKNIWLHKCVRRKMKDHHPSQMRRRFCSELLVVPESNGSTSMNWTLSDGQVILGNNTWLMDAGTEGRYQKRKKWDSTSTHCNILLWQQNVTVSYSSQVCWLLEQHVRSENILLFIFGLHFSRLDKWGRSVASSRDFELKK